jgi:ankyrin repeat protein
VLPEGETILMTAARTGRAEVSTMLLDAGAKPTQREKWHGESALHWAAAENHARGGRACLLDARRRASTSAQPPRPIAGDPASRSCRSAAGRR